MWEECVRRVVPYVPGEQPKGTGLIKLNTNENPYPPAPGVAEKLKSIDTDAFRKYPDPECSVLTNAISKVYGMDEDRIFVGVGSDDVLSMSFMTFFNSARPVLFPDVTYSFYEVWANLYGIPFERVSLQDDFTIEPSDYFKENGGIVIANPNAPTGLSLPLASIEEIVKRNPDSVVIVDEAYIDFGGTSALPLTDKYENLLVVQTFSKSRSLAGLRVGFAFGSKKLISYLKDVKFSFNSYTLNLPSLELAAASMLDTAYFKETTEKIIATRERTKEELKKLNFTFFDSETNFIFCKHATIERDCIFSELRKRNIIVRAFNGERIKDYIRISIGTDEEMDAVIEALKEIVR